MVRSAKKAQQQTTWARNNRPDRAYDLMLKVVDQFIGQAAADGNGSTTITVNNLHLRPLLVDKQLRDAIANKLAQHGYTASWYPNYSPSGNAVVQYLTVSWEQLQ